MTLKQISKDCGIDYNTMYQACSYAGLLIRGTKNAEYDEESVLYAVVQLQHDRILMHRRKIDEIDEVRTKALKKLGLYVENELSKLLREMRDGSLCYECPFDCGGVHDCIGTQKYGRCLLDQAAKVIERSGMSDRPCFD